MNEEFSEFLSEDELHYIANFGQQIDRPILILDFGSQFVPLIYKRLRERAIFGIIENYNIPFEKIQQLDPIGIILSGSGSSVYEENAPTIDKKLFELDIPILGICYGQQLICHLFGGMVEATGKKEYGKAEIEILKQSVLFDGVENRQVWMSHGDSVTILPEGFEILAKTSSTQFAVIANRQKQIYGVQFHPETSDTLDGIKILDNFFDKIVKIYPNPSLKNFHRMYSL